MGLFEWEYMGLGSFIFGAMAKLIRRPVEVAFGFSLPKGLDEVVRQNDFTYQI